MTIQTNTTDRKALVKAISEELGVPAVYLRAPTYAYRIGDFIIDRDGNIVGDDFGALRNYLVANGFLPDEATPIPREADAEIEPAKDEALDSKAEPVTEMDISVPVKSITLAQLRNVVFTMYARQKLINRMTQSNCLNIPGSLIDQLKQALPETTEAFTALLDDSRASAGLAGFDYRNGNVSMTFPFDEAQPEQWTAYANLLNRLFDSASKATRVFPEIITPDDQNEKYLAHVWLQRLGYHGADFKAERKILLGHLKGYCAFGNGDKMQAHKKKYTALRRERRLAEQEAAVLEVMVEEATENE